MSTSHTDVVSLDELARRLRLSRRWLHREALDGRLPSLKAGKQRRFNIAAVERTLAERAAGGPDWEGGAQ